MGKYSGVFCILLGWGAVALGAADPLARPEGTQCGVKARAASTLEGDQAAGAVADAFRYCLGAYIRRQTDNPPGREQAGVDFLEAVFRELGIPTLQVSTVGPRDKTPRPSLIATLTPSNAVKGPLESEGFAWGPSTFRDPSERKQPSVILLSHIDVIGVTDSEWAQPGIGWSGKEYDYQGRRDLWGRGTLDMKGIGMLQLFAMAQVKARRTPIQKTIHLIAVADEEEDAVGAISILKQIRRGGDLEALLGAEVALGEGGFSVVDALGKGTLTHLIGTEEKGGAWLEFQHPKGSSLIDAFNRLGILPRARKHYIWGGKALGCSLEEAQSGGVKFNVSPSLATARIRCRKAVDVQRMREVFSVADEPKLDAQRNKLPMAAVEVHQARELEYTLSIHTATTEHGANSAAYNAVEVLAIGLQRLGVLDVNGSRPDLFKYTQTESTRYFVKTVGETHNFGFVPRIPNLPSWIGTFSFLEQAALGGLGGALATEKLFRTACLWTAFTQNAEGSSAKLDCRLGHPTAMSITPGLNEGKQFADLLSTYVDDSGLGIKVVNEWNYTSSPIQSEDVRSMFGELRAEWKHSAPTPWLFPAGSDLRLFREPHVVGSELEPVPSYGFFPCPIPMSYLSTVHGANERYPVDQIAPSVRVYHRVVERLAH